jgi:pimeloyl-ACP methyl ester carboxylesterase
MIDLGGRRLHVVRRGGGSPTVVFESGGGGGSSAQNWPVLRRVAAFTRAVAYDRAGLGWSDPAPRTPTFEGMARDLEALLRASGETPPYVLAASSFGGLPARTFCRLFPGEVAGLVLVDTAEEEKYFATLPRFRDALEAELRRAAQEAASGALRRAQEPSMLAAGGLDNGEKAALAAVLDRPGHFEGSLAELKAVDAVGSMQRRAGGFGDLGERPLVVLSHGKPYTGDYAVWEDGAAAAQDRLAQLSKQGRHIVARANGHSIGLENPDLVAAAIEAVVNAVRGSAFDCSRVESLAAG